MLLLRMLLARGTSLIRSRLETTRVCARARFAFRLNVVVVRRAAVLQRRQHHSVVVCIVWVSMYIFVKVSETH